MIKIGMLLPEAEMLERAKKLIQKNEVEVVYLKAINTVDAVNEARLAVEAGSHIIIARGYQAKLIRQYTNIPVVEMRFHAQEIGLLIQKAKMIVKKEYPVIGLIAFENMLCDLSHMEELFQIRFLVKSVRRVEEVDHALAEIAQEKPDIIIGGEMTCRAAETMGFPSLFFQSTEESLKEALITAKSMAEVAESEKMNTAQFETVLDTSFNGIIKVNTEGNVIVINKLVENLLGKNKEDVVGLPLSEVFPQIDMSQVDSILNGENESYSTSFSFRHMAWMLLVAPIQYEELITGAILSIHKIADASAGRKERDNGMRLHGFSVNTNFQNIHTENKKMKNVLEDAKTFALSDSPILMYAQAGLEDYMIAEALHNNSNRKAGPYVSINIQGMEKEKQMEELFKREAADLSSANGVKGAMIKAHHGTLYIRGIEHLTKPVQNQILKTMLSENMVRTDSQLVDAVDVRIIASSKCNLRHLVQKGEFSEELYYLLHGLVLEVPALKQREEDLLYYFNRSLKENLEKYNRYLILSEDGKNMIRKLEWEGNILQIRAFCERLVLVAKKRVIDDAVIRKLYEELYPNIGKIKGEDKVIIFQSPEAVQLGELLEKHHGNRSLAAQELGISTTTLWRRMKKYGIEANYNKNE